MKKNTLVLALGFMIMGLGLMVTSNAAVAVDEDDESYYDYFSSEYKVCRLITRFDDDHEVFPGQRHKYLAKVEKSAGYSCNELSTSWVNGIQFWSYARGLSKYCHRDESVCSTLRVAELLAITDGTAIINKNASKRN